MSSEREDLVGAVLDGGRTLSTAAVMFHETLAARVGLSATENKALELLQRFGPMTPARLAEESGLAPASVTALVDRLVRKGAALREPHPQDGRRVLVRMAPEHLTRMVGLFGEFVGALQAACAPYTDDELRVVARFMADAAAVQQRSTGLLAEGARAEG